MVQENFIISKKLKISVFLQPEDYDDIMNSLEKVFTLKAGANAPEDFFALQTAAISAWTLLSTLLPSSRALESLESHLDLFENLLEAANVDLRIATGEALAVLYESGYDHDEDTVTDLVEILIPRYFVYISFVYFSFEKR